MKFYPPALVFGFCLIMFSIWGGIGISYALGETHWAQLPLGLTAIFAGLFGLWIFLGGITTGASRK